MAWVQKFINSVERCLFTTVVGRALAMRVVRSTSASEKVMQKQDYEPSPVTTSTSIGLWMRGEDLSVAGAGLIGSTTNLHPHNPHNPHDPHDPRDPRDHNHLPFSHPSGRDQRIGHLERPVPEEHDDVHQCD